ncbi:MAG: ATP-dependent DNA helicase [Armatimonadota bacterium]|nr:ATP-dependent DNA helicase [Armatimonadota bacterium]MDR7464279.1 ATP-dependent DNA helicase [Armatimonadota bacterium]MDR7468777.1 ATP-dependent DNA helicase [Armatimonadota bacterium]MDR7473702.1 ATP-dependent DNA helicase [Armatimonadota bacterium]MDR7538604.1 ATP-dependent DNA helicase [Armatimonadota bacterium]
MQEEAPGRYSPGAQLALELGAAPGDDGPGTDAVDRILEGLSEEQRAAVTHEEGPLLIVAGAGTGKTAVITRRIAWLIATRRARPDEILALTFTDKAAAEMEERVDLLVPYGYTDITICTFHAFGDRILREHALELGLTPDFRVLSRAEQVIFLKERLFDLPLDYYRPLGDPTRYVEALIALFSRAKDEDVSPEEYRAYAEGLAAASRAEPENAELRDAAAQQAELAQAYQTYQALLAKHGLVDFGDQIVLPLRLFRQRSAILRQYQERFRYILVDEFQDTNYAQFQLVQLLAAGHGNITVVGDDDQSIFKFRGASISNILGFTAAYPYARLIVLTRNYRSPQSVLDAAYRLIRHNDPDRLEVRNRIDKRLLSVNGSGPQVTHLHFDTLSSEADGVAGIIAERVASGAYRYRDFAILVRSNSDADPFLRALNMRALPYRFTGSRGLYNREEIRLAIAFLRALANPQDNLSLYYLGVSPLYLLDPTDLAKALAYAHRKNRTLEYVFRRLQHHPDLAEELSAETRAALSRLLDDLEEMRRLMTDHSTGRVLYTYLVSRTGYIRRLATSGRPGDEAQVQNLARFFDIVARYGEIAAYDRVPEFVRHLDDLIAAGDDPPVAEADPEADAVSVLTVHKAKGLEFPVVFIVSCVSQRFPTQNRGEPIPLPDPLVKDLLPSGDFHLQEERRLFYVGMTRARQELFLTSARDYGGARPRKVSRFVLEALDRPAPDGAQFRASAVETIHRHAPPAEGQQTLSGVAPQDQPVVLSFRQVDDYATCPLKYKYTHILRVPLLRDHRVVYGTAIHEAVREYNRRRARGQPVTYGDLLATFERAWVNEGFISREHEDQRMEEGRQVLRQFLDFQDHLGLRPAFVEAPFSFQVGMTRVKGRWDRVDLRGGEPVVIDFKTSDVRRQAEADRRARESLQLAVYALAYREVYGQLPARLELHFLGPHQVLVGTAHPEEGMLDDAREVIEHVARGLRAQHFIATPDYYRACRYCAFNSICPYTATGDPVLPEPA